MQLLVAVDFSDSSRIVIEYVTDLANVVCGKIWLLHVAEPDPEFVGYDVDPPEIRDVIARRFHKEHLQIQQLSQELRSKGLDCEALLIQGPTVETILRESKKLSVDMVVVGSHGKNFEAPSCRQYERGRVTPGIYSRACCPDAWSERIMRVPIPGFLILDPRDDPRKKMYMFGALGCQSRASCGESMRSPEACKCLVLSF